MKRFSTTTLLFGAAAFLAAAAAPAQGPGNADIQQAVARVSYLSGDVSYNRGDQPDVWEDAAVNVPMSIGDRLYLRGDGRAELQLEGGNFVRLGAQSDLSVLNLTDEVEQFSLQGGTASFRLARLGSQDSFEVDTPNVAVTFEQAGDYRLDVDADGNTRVGVRRGQALVAAGGGQVPLSAGSEMDITGIDSPQYDVVALPGLFPLCECGRRRNGRSRRIRSVERHSPVRPCLVAGARGSRLATVPCRPLGLAGSLGLDLDRRRAVGLGAVPLRTLGQSFVPLVLGPRGAGRRLRELFPRARRLRRRRSGLVGVVFHRRRRVHGMVPSRPPRPVRSLVGIARGRLWERHQRDLRQPELRHGRQP